MATVLILYVTSYCVKNYYTLNALIEYLIVYIIMHFKFIAIGYVTDPKTMLFLFHFKLNLQYARIIIRLVGIMLRISFITEFP